MKVNLQKEIKEEKNNKNNLEGEKNNKKNKFLKIFSIVLLVLFIIGIIVEIIVICVLKDKIDDKKTTLKTFQTPAKFLCLKMKITVNTQIQICSQQSFDIYNLKWHPYS